MKNQTRTLSFGKYMACKPVFDAMYFQFCRPSAAEIIKKTCTVLRGEHTLFFDVEELKKVLTPDLFKDLECVVTTHWIVDAKS